ncbi:glycosyltransferase involved in cell wall biosynthesis [Pedobacter sp. AK017]|uniref:glycosyltransferase n=1 Tax=Pedobacter sp. AK017 TaxID=2723073 RepID=UPI001830629A|nr:glycosyltransferase [Pedobacter sp. AK017]MBB5439625.1 glycosyltransferase involved in cell wall biosynthesis [Pedobacter sp. AK017]
MVVNFSVLMPIYYKENPAYLKMSLDSILDNQTIRPKELIIVKDGALTPGLDNVLNDYYVRYPDIITLLKLKENMGMGYAMNFGLNRCSYEWVFRMDSDDIAIPTRFEKQLKVINSGKYDVVGSSIEEFNHCAGDLKRFRIMPEGHEEIIRFMKVRNPINHMSVAFKKSVAIKAGGYWDKRYFEDYNLWYEMFKVNAKFYNIQDALVHARVGNNMVGRRSGYAYYKYEQQLLNKFLKDGFISSYKYRIILMIKFILRILPIPMLNWFYYCFLRVKG